MENDDVQTESAPDVDGASAMTEAERLKKEKEKERQKKKKEAKKEKEKEAKEAKKDKGGKDDKKKEGEKKKKTPGDFIKEQLRKKQEEEERLRQEQEAEERRLAEIERLREEKLQKEKERKEREKQKKKDKIAQLKKEGKYMTPEQKQKLQRQREMVEMLKQQGAVVVGTEGKENAVPKKPKYSDKKKAKAGQTAENGAESHEPSPEDGAANAEADEEGGEGGIAESWDQLEEVGGEDKSEEETSSEEEESSEDEESSASDTQAPTAQPAAPAAPVIKEPPPPPVQSQISQSQSQQYQHETKEETRERITNRIKQRRQAALAKRNVDHLRSPVICVLGHVDTGKTKILDKIRRTHVQDAEAGGITQQIGATMVPADAIKEQAKMVKDFEPELLQLPGFLIIDTPGHESFSNLRSRGSSLCDIAILVVDIMHALEPQTIESLNLLKKRNTPFIVALNKVDRLYQWKQNPHKDIRNVLKSQQPNCQAEFNERVQEVKLKFAEQGVNAALFWENPDPTEYVSLVPTSAITGDGMGNLIAALAQHAQSHLKERLAFSDEVRCTILEVKVLTGLGTTLDVILVDGTLHLGDTIVVPGTEGAIVTQIRGLLMPAPLKEMRVKNDYKNHDVVKGAQGIKILAKDLEKALAGLPLMVAQQEDEVDILKDEVEAQLEAVLKSFKVCERGVYVQASTLGALEALLTFLRDQKLPYSGINIGPVHKKDVIKASTMLEHDSQWAVILAFDVQVDRDAQRLADEQGVRIFTADIIYHLQDAYLKFREEWKEKKRQENAHLAIYPVKMRVLPAHIFNSRDPLVMGVMIEDGIAKVGTPICVPSKENILLGTVSSLEANHKALDIARKGQEVCVKIENTTGDAPKMYGRHFDYQDMLVSKITRESIDVMKTYFRDDLQKSDWQLIVELKKQLGIL